MKRFLYCTVIFTMVFMFCISKQVEALPTTIDYSTLGFGEAQSLEGSTIDIGTYTSETTDLYYTNSYGAGLRTGGGSTGDIFISFSAPINNLSMTAGDGAGDLDAFAFTLFEFGTNANLGTWSSPQFGGSNEPEWYTLSAMANNIGSITFDPGNSGVLPGTTQSGGGIVLTEISYDQAAVQPIPEPTTVALLGFGLAGLAGAEVRRRRKKKAVDKS